MLILLINLERRPDRLEFMSAQLGALGLPFQRIDAIDARNGDFGPVTATLSGAERACALSHRKAWQYFLETGQERCLILEDDLIVSSKLKPFLDDPSNIPRGVDVLRLETRLMLTRLSRSKKCHTAGFKIHRMHSPHYGCAAYILSRDFARAAVRDITDFSDPVDHVIFAVGDQCFYPAAAYQLRPALGIQAELVESANGSTLAVSDLQPERIKRFDRKPGGVKIKRSVLVKCLREIGRVLRNLKTMGTAVNEVIIHRGIKRKIPFAGSLSAATTAALHVHRSEQAVQPEVPTLRLLATE